MKAYFAFFSVCALLTASSACSFLPHKHKWNNYIVKYPNCTEKGLIERLCEECGEKEYEDVMPNGHNFQNGACLICGAFGYLENQIIPEKMPDSANNTAAWSLEKIYQTAQKIGNTDDYVNFIRSLSFGQLDTIYFDNLGLLHLTATVTTSNNAQVEIPLLLSVSKVSPISTIGNKFGYISSIQIVNDQLTITYSDGLQVSAGRLLNSAVTITKFGINPNNDFIIYYSDNTIAFAGKVPEGKIADTQTTFIYRQVNNGYAIVDVFNINNDSVLSVPVSHKGKAVSIEANAFKKLKDQQVAVIIPESVTAIDPLAFKGLNFSTALYFEGDRSNYMHIIPLTSARLYFKGEWSYSNGLPTPNP